MVLLGVSVALSIQMVGALLVLALLITPAAAALRVTSSPVAVVVLSVVFAMVATVGGILLALGGRIPDQPLRHHAVIPDLRGVQGDRHGPRQARAQRQGGARGLTGPRRLRPAFDGGPLERPAALRAVQSGHSPKISTVWATSVIAVVLRRPGGPGFHGGASTSTALPQFRHSRW